MSAASPVLGSKFLEGLPKAGVTEILAAASHRRFLARSVIANQGHPADNLYLLSEGCARHFFLTPDGRKVFLLWMAPGDVIGGASILSKPTPYYFSTEMVKDSWAYVWPRRIIRELAARHPLLLENGLSIAADYISWYFAAHLALISHTARQRLAHVLVGLASTFGEKSKDGIALDVTNEDLASEANVTPFTASRVLSQWQRSGAIVKSRGKLLLRHPERLSSH